MTHINAVVVSGNLGQDPQLRHTGNGTPVLNLRIANSYRKKVGEEWEDAVSWQEAVIWGGLAELAAAAVSKGQFVVVQGELRPQVREVFDADGNSFNVHTAQIKVRTINWAKGDYTQSESEPAPKRRSSKQDNFAPDDDLPF